MDGRELYGARVLELIRLNAIRSARSVSSSIRRHYFANAADATLQRKSEAEPVGAQLDFGETLDDYTTRIKTTRE